MSEVEAPEIVVYTHPDCGFSTAVKIDYTNRGIAFREIDISVQPGSDTRVGEVDGRGTDHAGDCAWRRGDYRLQRNWLKLLGFEP